MNQDKPVISDKAREHHERYTAALHAMQSAVAFSMSLNQKEGEPKHLRVGINSTMVEHAALTKVLVAKGVLTYEEFYGALADQMEEEVRSYEQKLEHEHGLKNVRFR